MPSLWELVKRHKGKIAVTSVVAGGIYLGHRCYEIWTKKDDQFIEQEPHDFNYAEFLNEYSEIDDDFLSSFESGLASTGASRRTDDRSTKFTRKMYIFKSNQKTCERTIIQLIPSLKSSIHKIYDIEAIQEALRNGLEVNKVESWQKIKVMTFSRLFTAIYSYSLLIISLKAQISIVAADVYARNETNHSSRSHFDFGKLFESVFGHKLPSFLGNHTDNVASNVESDSFSGTQQIFLQALQYFISQGCDLLAERINKIVVDVLSDVSLKQNLSLEQIQRFLFDIRVKVHRVNFSTFVVPLPDVNTCDLAQLSATPLAADRKLTHLLNLLKVSLEGAVFKDVMSTFVDEFLRASVIFLRSNRNEWKNGCGYSFAESVRRDAAKYEPPSTAAVAVASSSMVCFEDEVKSYKELPLAKVLPTLSDCFYFISRTEPRSIVDKLISIPCVQRYCMEIFDNYKAS